MTEQDAAAEETPARRGRKRVKRNYAKELEALQARVDAAVRLLGKAGAANGVAQGEIIAVAIETLTEE